MLDVGKRLAAWSRDRPGIAVLLAALGGVLLAGFMVHELVDACFAATEHWTCRAATPLGGCKHPDWAPGQSRAFWGMFRISAQLCAEATKSPPWILISGMVAAPSILLTWYWRDRKRRDDHRLALESGIAERYTRAAELLASADAMTRINGLFSLWDVARESQSHRVTVSRTLAAFVRVRSAASRLLDGPVVATEAELVRDTRVRRKEDSTESAPSPLPDVQTAATLVSAPEWATAQWREDGLRISLDLRGAKLAAFDFSRKDLSGAFLREADLRHAYLHHANLRDALLMEADLSGAYLRSSDCRGANLRDANLSSANLIKADLRGTKLTRASLSGAIYCGRTTKLPDGFDPEAHGMVREDTASEVGPVAAARRRAPS